MAAPFIGNADYRGYLNYLGGQGDTQAKSLITGGAGNLGYANNQGNITLAPSGLGTISSGLYDYNTKLYNQYNQLQNPSIASIYGTGGAGTIVAPKYDTAALSAQARAAATGAVSPYYQSQLNDFLAKQAAERQQTETQNATNVKNYQDTLAQTLAQNDITQGRTAQDTAQKEANTAQAADYRQTDQGTAFDANRITQAIDQAKSGIGGPRALGQQTQTQEKFNTTESRQATADQQANQQAELFKNRTFEDLARTGDLAKTAEGKQEAQAKFDLESYIQNQGLNEQATRNQLETQKQAEIARQQHGYAQDIFNKYLTTLSNPQRLAAVQTYGGSF